MSSNTLSQGMNSKRSRLPKPFQKAINYYSLVKQPKHVAQSLDEIYLFFGLIKCRPWFIIVACIVTQFLYGSVYSWSIFNAPINTRIYGDPDANKAQITYYIALGVLGATGALMGPWIESHHPRTSTIIGCALFFLGHILAGVAMQCNKIGLLYFGYGIVCGMGLGIGYVTSVDVLTKWFPKFRGLASGVAVAGFGGGSMAFTEIDKKLIAKVNLPPTFFILGAIMLVIQLTCTQFMAFPPAGWNANSLVVATTTKPAATTTIEKRKSKDSNELSQVEQNKSPYKLQSFDKEHSVAYLSLGMALRSRDFWFLYVGFLANILFALVIISNLANMVTNLFGPQSQVGKETPLEASVVVTITSAFNTCGRIFTGLFSDRFGRKNTLLLLLAIQIIVICILPHAISNGVFWEFVVPLWIAVWCYGGGFGMIPAFLADMFGVDNTSSCHGVFLTAWSISSIGGGLLFIGIIDRLQDDGRSPHDPYIYNVNLYWMLSISCVGFLSTLFVRATARDRLFPAVPGQLLRIRVFGRQFRVSYAPRGNGTDGFSSPNALEVEYLTRAQEKAIWDDYLEKSKSLSQNSIDNA